LKHMAWRNLELFAASFLRPSLFRERTGLQALGVLDDAGIRQGVLLSEAYLLTSPLADTDAGADVAKLTREENAFNVDAALASGGRLVAFVSVNPLSLIALDEVRHWAGKPGVAGIKLHLANSGFKPQSPSDVAALARFLDLARALNLPLVIHVRNAVDYTR